MRLFWSGARLYPVISLCALSCAEISTESDSGSGMGGTVQSAGDEAIDAEDDESPAVVVTGSTGGDASSGGTDGAAAGGTTTDASGGSVSGGNASGGTSSGGTSAGGTSSGGAASGGSASGGAASGGAASGGTTSGGSSGGESGSGGTVGASEVVFEGESFDSSAGLVEHGGTYSILQLEGAELCWTVDGAGGARSIAGKTNATVHYGNGEGPGVDLQLTFDGAPLGSPMSIVTFGTWHGPYTTASTTIEERTNGGTLCITGTGPGWLASIDRVVVD